jgi:competence protein ComEC
MHSVTLVALLGMLSGIVYGETFLFSTEVALTTFLIGCVAFVLAILKQKKEWSYGEGKKVLPSGISLFIGIFFCMFAVGVVRVQFEERANSFVCEQSCTFNAEVMTSPKIKDESQTFAVLPESEVDTAYVQVRAPLYPRFQRGDKVLLSGVVRVPKNFMTHGDTKSFNYGEYLALHVIGSEMIYPHIELHNVVGSPKNFTTFLTHLRENFVTTISHYVDDPASTLASGMLFGDSSMSRELTQTFRVAGLSHIVVLSGFNIAILISFVLFICMFLPLILRVLIAGVFVIFFVLMVGGEVSVIRATLMSAVALVALLLGRAYTARQALLLSLLVIVLYEPSHLLSDVSLHLSFLATAGIIYASASLTKLFTKIKSDTYREIVVTTCAAYGATLPYLMYTFGTVSLYALITNMLVLPMVPFMMLLTFLIVISAPWIPILGMIIGYVCTTLGEVIIFIARSVEALPFASLQVSLSFQMMIGTYILIVALLYYVRTRKKNETLLTNNDEILSDVISY